MVACPEADQERGDVLWVLWGRRLYNSLKSLCADVPDHTM